MYERTTRIGDKWAKLTKIATSKYAVALGWRGEFKATTVRYGPSKTWADVVIRHWLKDNGP